MANCGFYLWRLNERASMGSCPQLRHPTSGFIWFPSPLALYIVWCLRQQLSTASASQFQLSQAFQEGDQVPTQPPRYALNPCSGLLSHFISMCECYAALGNKIQIGKCGREGPWGGCMREEKRSVFLHCVWRQRSNITSLVAFSAPYRGDVETLHMETCLISRDQLGSSWRRLHLPCSLDTSS